MVPSGYAWTMGRLQRGLGIAAEDRRPLAAAERSLRAASTRPRHRCRGSTSRRTRMYSESRGLQRGLGIAAEDRAWVAAGGEDWGLLQRGLGIAAEDRPSAPMVSVEATKPLQRGLGIAAEDRRERAVCSERAQGASTRPRHRCRGSLVVGGVGANSAHGLQRGLGIAAEDRSMPPRSTTATRALQRGLGIAAEDRTSAAAVSPPSTARFNEASASLPRIVEGLRCLESAHD